MIYTELGERIKSARKNKKLSQETLSKRVGLSRSSITNIERGRQHIPFHTLFIIADALGVQPTSLIPEKQAQKHPVTNKLDKEMSEKYSLEDDAKDYVQRIISSKIR